MWAVPNEHLNRREKLMEAVLGRAETTGVFARGTVQGEGDATVKHHVELVGRVVCDPTTDLKRGRLFGCSRKVGRDPGLAIIAIRVKNLEGIKRPSRDRKLGGEDIRYLRKGWVHRGSVANTVKRGLVEHVLQEGSSGILSPKQVSDGSEGEAIGEKHVLELPGPVSSHRGDRFIEVEAQLGRRRKRLRRRGSQMGDGRLAHKW